MWSVTKWVCPQPEHFSPVTAHHCPPDVTPILSFTRMLPDVLMRGDVNLNISVLFLVTQNVTLYTLFCIVLFSLEVSWKYGLISIYRVLQQHTSLIYIETEPIFS